MRVKAAVMAALAATLFSPVIAVAERPAAGGGAPAKAMLLFVAGWCAPCRTELRALGPISRTAAPRRVLVVPIDAERGTERMLETVPASQILRLDAAAATALMRRLAGGAPGLPLTVVTDRLGQPCATQRRPLTAGDVTTLLARCSAQSSGENSLP